jgi:hypothetical protein
MSTLIKYPRYSPSVKRKMSMLIIEDELYPQLRWDILDEQVGSGRYSSVSEYVRDLIRDDERRKVRDKREAMLSGRTAERGSDGDDA